MFYFYKREYLAELRKERSLYSYYQIHTIHTDIGQLHAQIRLEEEMYSDECVCKVQLLRYCAFIGHRECLSQNHLPNFGPNSFIPQCLPELLNRILQKIYIKIWKKRSRDLFGVFSKYQKKITLKINIFFIRVLVTCKEM